MRRFEFTEEQRRVVASERYCHPNPRVQRRLEMLWLKCNGETHERISAPAGPGNGPENNSRRTQFLKRMVAFAQQWQIKVRLAYYPPYHSKYNPVERCWGVLENYWNGEILDEIETALRFAETMTWKGKHPHVELVPDTYRTGIRLTRTGRLRDSGHRKV